MSHLYLIDLWEQSKRKIKNNNLTYSLSLEGIWLYNTKGLILGKFTDVRMLYGYLCGYENS